MISVVFTLRPDAYSLKVVGAIPLVQLPFSLGSEYSPYALPNLTKTSSPSIALLRPVRSDGDLTFRRRAIYIRTRY